MLLAIIPVLLKIPPPPPHSQAFSQGAAGAVISNPGTAKIIPGEYIVIFKDPNEAVPVKGVRSEQSVQQTLQKTQRIISEYSITNDAVLSKYQYALQGFATKLDSVQLKKLKNDPRIDHISPNKLFKLNTVNLSPVTAVFNTLNSREKVTGRNILLSGQTIPWGVNRVNGPIDAIGETAWIIDTGIDLYNNDLNVDVQNSVSFIAGQNANDVIGHGTHVAGILAAKDNSIDVVGVAAGATVVAIKVCKYYYLPDGTRYVGCPENSILDGVDYVENHAGQNDVVNMSLGGPADPDIDAAVLDAAQSLSYQYGVSFFIAAGNSSDDAGNYSPARVDMASIYTISAYDQNDAFVTDFSCSSVLHIGSNYGNPPIEYGGPGDNILSLDIGGGTTTKCGTSMATPHIAGLHLANDGSNFIFNAEHNVSGDPDGEPDRILIKDVNLAVTFNGPEFLDSGETGTWTAHVFNNNGSVTYTWYSQDVGSNTWDYEGNNPTMSTSFINQLLGNREAKIKVTVTSGGETDTQYGNVYIMGQCPPGHGC